MKILACNAGSTSLKFKLLEFPAEEILLSGKVERIGSGRASLTLQDREKTLVEGTPVLAADYLDAVNAMLSALNEHAVKRLDEIDCAVFKVVHAGSITESRVIDDEVIKAMERYITVAPLHNRIYLEVIRAFMRAAPYMKRVAAFEPDFHRTMPDCAKTYGIPYELASEHGIFKYGFHGASHEYIAWRSARLMPEIPAENLRVISCHLGGSSSLCALRGGKSLDATQGFSPQSGITMGTRNGDLDVYAIFYLHAIGYSMEKLNDILYNESGLKGISGVGEDMRDIENAAAKGNGRARLALDVYSYEIKKHIGAYWAVLGGADAIVFTGGIGENSWLLRERVCGDLRCFGVKVDVEKNRSGKAERLFSAGGSEVKLFVIPTNEELTIARKAAQVLAKRAK